MGPPFYEKRKRIDIRSLDICFYLFIYYIITMVVNTTLSNHQKLLLLLVVMMLIMQLLLSALLFSTQFSKIGQGKAKGPKGIEHFANKFDIMGRSFVSHVHANHVRVQ